MDNDRRREALRVRFTADVEADASEVGGGGGGGVVEAGGEPMIFYTITYKIGLMKRGLVISCFMEGKSLRLLNKTPPHKETRQINQRTLKDR